MAFASNPYYSVITIDYTQVDGTLTDYRLYLDDLPSDAYAEIHSTGKDIRFSDDTGTTELEFDLREIDTTGGTCNIVVLVPSVSVTVDTDIRIWYGDHTLSLVGASDTYGRNNTYNSTYQLVNPLSEESSGTGTTDLYVDRTGNGNDGDDYASATGTTGKWGDGQEFDGANDYIIYPSGNFQTQATGTIMCWVYPTTLNQAAVFYHTVPTGIQYLFGFEIADFYTTINQLRIYQRVNTSIQRDIKPSTAISLNTWTHVAITVDGSGLRVLVNGVAPGSYNTYSGTSVSNTSWFDDTTSASSRTVVGTQRYNGLDYRFYDGFLNEFYIADAAMSDAEIVTTYNNQNAAYGTFYTVGTKQTAPVTSNPFIRYILVY